MPLALVFAQKHGAGLEAPRAIGSRLVPLGEAIEMHCDLRIETAEGLLQQRNRAMRSLVKAGGREKRNVVRQRVRSSSRPSGRTRSISASIASQSNKERGMVVTRPCAPGF